METNARKPSLSSPVRSRYAEDAATDKTRRLKHQRTKLQPLTRDAIDGRTNAAKQFDAIAEGIATDLGGRDRLSTVEAALIEAFAGATIHVNQLNTLLLLGEAINLADHAAAISAMVRVAARIGIHRRPRDVTPLADLMRSDSGDSEVVDG
jgi:hypothetical protein